jgi:hypothetical protein
VSWNLPLSPIFQLQLTAVLRKIPFPSCFTDIITSVFPTFSQKYWPSVIVFFVTIGLKYGFIIVDFFNTLFPTSLRSSRPNLFTNLET